MNTRLLKETREVMPLLIATLLFIVLPYAIWGRQPGAFGYLGLGLGCAVMAASAFGSEFQHKTFALLLSQPLGRTAMWLEKMLVLTVALAITTFVLYACLRIFVWDQFSFLEIIFIPLCTLCGAPYLTLLTRNGIAGAAFSIILPVILCIVPAEMIGRREFALLLLVGSLSSYCALMLGLGYARFKRLQLFEGASGELKLPAGMESATRPLARLFPKSRGAFTSLLVKELRLQQMSFVMAVVFCLIALGGAMLRVGYEELGDLVLELNLFFYLCAFPFVVGALAVAEERGQGILDWQLTLPPSVRKQWYAKIIVTFATSALLGLLLPFLLHIAGAGFSAPHGFKDLPPTEMIPVVILGYMLFMSIAVYAGSFCRNTLKAILLAVLLALVTFYFTPLGVSFFEAILYTGTTFGLITRSAYENWVCATFGVLMLMSFFQFAAYRHYRQVSLPLSRVVLHTVGLMLLSILWIWAFVLHLIAQVS